MNAGLGEARRFGNLLLGVALLCRLSDQAVAAGMQLLYAAELVSYLAKLG